VCELEDDMSNSEHLHFQRPSAVPWPPILLVLAAGGAVILGRVAPLGWPGLDDLPARVVGLGIGALGVLLMGWALWTLHSAQTNILPHKAADKLVTSGPFARFRNPIYLADTMILLGLAELTKNVWFAIGALAFGVLVTFLAILPEERHLLARFGDEYRAYKGRTRRWL
jgi:protein-S-isoprenylcysteine O-methyltransferase Ste14